MKKIVLIIGARPNFMKAFPVYNALKEDFDLTLIHTGQHFDEKMSKVFFEQLKFPKPDIHLTLNKKTKAGDFDYKLYIDNEEYLKNKNQVIEELINFNGDLGQIGEIRDKLKVEFEKIKPDLVMVFGDVTSTLAAGLASKMLNIDIAHVESGLRSGDIKMPEEVNRILTDYITKYYFVTEQSGVDNLKAEGITGNVYLVGNTMIDTQKKYLAKALDTKYHEKLGVKKNEYILVTLHRPSNVDNMEKLKEIFDDFDNLSKENKLVYPIHPRTKKNLEKLGYLKKVQENPNIMLDEPLGYLQFTCLMANCKYVVTDSGGLQEESTALNIPCFTLRENTERPSTLIANNGTNQLVSKISEIELKECKGSMNLWDGYTSNYICYHIHYCFCKFKNSNIIITNYNFTNYLDNVDNFVNFNIAYNNCVKKQKGQYIYGDIILNGSIEEKENYMCNVYLDRSIIKQNNYNKILFNYGKYFCVNIENNNFKLHTDFFGNQLIYYYNNKNKFIISDDFNYLLNILKENKINIKIQNFKKYKFDTAIDDYISNYNLINNQNVLFPYQCIEFTQEAGFQVCNNEITNYFMYEENITNNKTYNKYIEAGLDEIKNNILSILKFSEKEEIDVVADLTAGIDSRLLFSVILENKLQNKFLFNCDETSDNVDLCYFKFFVDKYKLKIYEKEKMETCSTYDVINLWRKNYTHFRPGFPRIKNKKIIRLSSGFGELYCTFYKKYNNNAFIPYYNDISNIIGNSYDIKKENHYLFYRHRIHFTEGMDIYNRDFTNQIIIYPLQSKFLLKASKYITFEERHNKKLLYDCIRVPYLKKININDKKYIDIYKKIKVSDISINELLNNIKLYKNKIIKINTNNFDVVKVIFKKELHRLYTKYNIDFDINKYTYRDILRKWKYYINYEQINDSKTLPQLDTIKYVENDNRVVYSFAQGIPHITNNDLFELTKNIHFNNDSFMYSKPEGYLKLRKKIIEHFSYNYNYNEILITPGIINSLVSFIFTIDNPVVALIEPFYIAYEKLTNLNINVERFIEKDFKFNKILSANCNILIITIPNNPNGIILNDIENIIFNCNYNQINLFIDLAYIVFIEENTQLYKKIIYLINKYKNVVWSFSFSKTIKCSGLRLGYCLSNNKKISEITKIQNYINNCPNSIGQTLIYTYLCDGTYEILVNNIRKELKKVKKYISDNNLFINNKGIIQHNLHNKIYFLYLELDKKINVKDLVEKLLKKGIGIVNGKNFETNANSVRICLARDTAYFNKLNIIDQIIKTEYNTKI